VAYAQVLAIISLLLTLFLLAIPRAFFGLLERIIGKIQQILERLLDQVTTDDIH
jgi:hypothetical protein